VNTGLKKYTWAITTVSSEGVGLGRHIESVQNSTGENLIPSRGGNDTVDVRGKYTEITWSRCFPGWAPHEMLGYGDANTETRYGNVMFSAYMNEASAAAAIVILSKLVTG
jgi:hypothetical protein